MGRDAGALEAVARACHEHGAEAVACAADLTDPAAVERIRDAAVAAYSRIDVWVNCAAVLMVGRFEDMPVEAFRRVIDVNLMGCQRLAGGLVAISGAR